MPVLQDDLNAWFHNPVTEEFFRVLKKRQDEIYQERPFFRGDPYSTQDAMAWRNGAGDMIQELLEMKQEENIYFDGEVHERIGDLPKRQPRTG